MFKGRRVRAVGTMSGTSLDGVDAAVLDTDGVDIFGFGQVGYRAYSEDEQEILRAHLGLWPANGVEQAARIVEEAHIALLKDFADVDLIGFHGQTLAHDPAAGRTHQAGDGNRLAQVLQRPVVWDFRTEDMRCGGQGAPLAPFYHFALAKWLGLTAPVVFLNLGGVGNITWVDPAIASPELPGALLAFDTGPANAPMNDVMRSRHGLAYDVGGALAATGQPAAQVLAAFAAHPYFDAMPPKSLDRDAFADLIAQTKALNDADAMRTLLQAAVDGVVRAMHHCPARPCRVLVVGGGRKNETMMSTLDAALDCEVGAIETVGLDGDMIEAQAFAYLAVRVAKGLPTSAPGTTSVTHPVFGGQIGKT
ncbi:anhydro-N-acetylmuramic acid kinase [Yoonia sediminilitoris]|uniref:Anhydro-N-acetylmuramic acid kinase n=1 Tax=Yoonia sediminilitoris TaxID=1286148 RepID=A0A2T6KRY9_9RHOB|nr:anhydro-N-acetylmuramic acid kinase [Yoonia sediminilitoris]PUB19321.1 anhydro-N-acetylmuramic acid kinase [Yoonia sediminilitoris]RCW99489.1 anhydro-N-acetylmuramic acid kinase [Yoonia sediminilitoris]